MGEVGVPELMLILVIALVVFGGKKLPEIGRGLGEGIRGFRDAMRGNENATGSATDELKK
ncbi:MAG: twin-arginine translocase TatA/TatE family subunit [Acidobacteria bacterium]|nr:twin-arginine translocase TatA/TatE family subunit [Acidobacteriota bacterium]